MREFFVPFFLSIFLTPLLSKVARKFGLVDKPDNILKNHDSAIPYSGGLTLYLCVLPFLNDLVLIFSLTSFMILGLIDDLKRLPWQSRLVIEFLLATMLAARFSKDVLAFFFYLFLIVTTINAINMSDGLDGACATIVSLGILLSNPGKIGLAFVGALVGYLVFNFPPAKVYMGDAGTYLLGAFVSYIMVSKMNHLLDVKPILPFFIPLLDLISAIIRRTSFHRSPFKGDLDHIHHKIFRRVSGTSNIRKRKVIFVLGLLTSAFGFASILRFGILIATFLAIFLVVYLRMFLYDKKGWEENGKI